jgi:ERCC4-type nuclease
MLLQIKTLIMRLIIVSVLYSSGAESTGSILADLVEREAGKNQGLPRLAALRLTVRKIRLISYILDKYRY